MEDGEVCMQELGHEADNVPHLKYGDGAEYWADRRNKENFKNKIKSIGFGTVPGGYKQSS